MKIENEGPGAAGYTWLDPSGTFPGPERSRHLGHLLIEADRPIPFGFHGSISLRLDSSPLLEIIEAYPGYPATFYRFSILREIGETWLSFTIGNELLPQTGNEADWVFALTMGRAPTLTTIRRTPAEPRFPASER